MQKYLLYIILSQIFPVVAMFGSFIVTGLFINYFDKTPEQTKQIRDLQVDGLRAILAFGVVSYHYFGLHHMIYSEGNYSLTWMHPIIQLTGVWTVPMFFAITGFLFTRKITSSEWLTNGSFLRLFSDRFFRLMPMMLLVSVLSLVLFIIGKEQYVANNLVGQISFGFLDVFDYEPIRHDYKRLVSGLQWSLHSEWVFYLSLPLICVVLTKRANFFGIFVSMLILYVSDGYKYIIHLSHDYPYMAWAFIPGIVCGHVRIHDAIKKIPRTPFVGILSSICIVLTAYVVDHKLKLFANTFFLASCLSCNTFTKVLEHKVLRILGETTYSVYLLHGVVQYVAMKWITPLSVANHLPEWIWWLSVSGQVVLIVSLSKVTYEYVEKPCVAFGKSVFGQIEKWLNPKGLYSSI